MSPSQKYPELKSYIRVGQRYIQKSFILIAVFAVLAAATAALAIGKPLYQKAFGRLVIGSESLAEYSGQGKVYDLDGNLLYEGMIADGVFSGNGWLYRKDGKLLYHGGFQDWSFSGTGTLYDENGLPRYEGGFENGIYQGLGALYEGDGVLAYQGEFAAGQFEGKGLQYKAGVLVYDGTFSAGERHGEGKLYQNADLVYEGGFASGQFEGKGRQYAEGKLVYDGEFSQGLYQGNGRLTLTGGMVYEGGFSQGAFSGEGRLTGNDLPVYEGGFQNGLYEGQGRLYDRAGALIYEGGFLAGKYSGQGSAYSAQQRLLYQGAYADGKRNGFGTLYAANGNPLFAGQFLQDQIDYAALLGKSAGEIEAIFLSRPFITSEPPVEPPLPEPSEPSTDDDVPPEGEETAEIAKTLFAVPEEQRFVCIGYEGMEAALIFSEKDGVPDFVEVVIVWEPPAKAMDTEGHYRSAPSWMELFRQNKMYPLAESVNLSVAVPDPETGLVIGLWPDASGTNTAFYTIEYPVEEGEKGGK